jgi:putative ABC transport system ATP-binding protein
VTELLAGRDLFKSFGLTAALRGASISVHSGEIVAVMGPSGCGKSTLLHCLAGILGPDAGEVHFAGQRIDQLPDRQRVRLRRTTFGFVFQFGQLVPELSAIENIALPLQLAGRRRRSALAAATTWLHRLDLAGLGERLPGGLSGGQCQRAASAAGPIRPTSHPTCGRNPG